MDSSVSGTSFRKRLELEEYPTQLFCHTVPGTSPTPDATRSPLVNLTSRSKANWSRYPPLALFSSITFRLTYKKHEHSYLLMALDGTRLIPFLLKRSLVLDSSSFVDKGDSSLTLSTRTEIGFGLENLRALALVWVRATVKTKRPKKTGFHNFLKKNIKTIYKDYWYFSGNISFRAFSIFAVTVFGVSSSVDKIGLPK